MANKSFTGFVRDIAYNSVNSMNSMHKEIGSKVAMMDMEYRIKYYEYSAYLCGGMGVIGGLTFFVIGINALLLMVGCILAGFIFYLQAFKIKTESVARSVETVQEETAPVQSTESAEAVSAPLPPVIEMPVAPTIPTVVPTEVPLAPKPTAVQRANDEPVLAAIDLSMFSQPDPEPELPKPEPITEPKEGTGGNRLKSRKRERVTGDKF